MRWSCDFCGDNVYIKFPFGTQQLYNKIRINCFCRKLFRGLKSKILNSEFLHSFTFQKTCVIISIKRTADISAPASTWRYLGNESHKMCPANRCCFIMCQTIPVGFRQLILVIRNASFVSLIVLIYVCQLLLILSFIKHRRRPTSATGQMSRCITGLSLFFFSKYYCWEVLLSLDLSLSFLQSTDPLTLPSECRLVLNGTQFRHS